MFDDNILAVPKIIKRVTAFSYRKPSLSITPMNRTVLVNFHFIPKLHIYYFFFFNKSLLSKNDTERSSIIRQG